MKTELGVTRILCFGDSNTWGYEPQTGCRYPSHIRWTGVLQNQLGPSYDVIEEGLNGRTTDVDYPDRVARNGKPYLLALAESQFPYQIAIMMLGTNDFKKVFNREASDIANAIRSLVPILRSERNEFETEAPRPRIILVSPPRVEETVVEQDVFGGAESKRKALCPLIEKIAKETGSEFFNAATVTEPSPRDGFHLEPDSHEQLGFALAKQVIGK